MSLKLVYQAAIGQYEKAMSEIRTEIATAATASFRELGETIKKNGRANIGAAGFSQKWQNALRVTVYPANGKKSVSPAIYITHNIRYAEIFEKGGSIAGKPLLWLPLSNMKAKLGTRRATPRNITREMGNILFRIKNTNLLAFKYYAPKGQGSLLVKDVSRAMLRSAVRTTRNSRRKAKPGMTLTTVPVFHGVSSVKIKKRFDLLTGFKRDAALFPALYLKNFKG